MKKGLLSLLAVALTVVGCQNYDDQFQSLTDQITDLSTKVDGLSALTTQVEALQTTVNGLATSAALADVDADVAAISTAIDGLVESLALVATTADLMSVSQTLSDVEDDVHELLEANAVINQNVVVNNEATLEYVESLISADGPAVIVNGRVEFNTNSFVPAISAELLERVNAVAAKIATVLGDGGTNDNSGLKVTSATPLTFDSLTFIDNNYLVVGSDQADDDLATISGGLTTDYAGSNDYSNLTSVGTVTISNNASATIVDFDGVDVAAVIAGGAAGVLTLDGATNINLGTADFTSISAAIADEVITKTTTTAGMTINAPSATLIDVSAMETATGAITVQGTGTVDFGALVSAQAITVSNSLVADFSSLTSAGEIHVVAATSSDFSSLADLAADAIIGGATIDLSALAANTTGTLELPNATVADLQSLITSNVVTATAAETVHVKSTAIANLVAPAATTIKLFEQAVSINVSNSFPSLQTLTIVGKDVGDAQGQENLAPAITITNNASLTSLIVEGEADSLTVTGSNASLASIETSGQITDLDIYNADALTTLTLGHDYIPYDTAITVEIHENAKLTSVDMSNLTKVKTIALTNNASLSAVVGPSATVLAEPGAPISVVMAGNDFAGTYSAGATGTAATETEPSIDPVEPVIVQASIDSIIAWFDIAAANADAGVATSTAIDISSLTSGTTVFTSVGAAYAADTYATAKSYAGSLTTSAERAHVVSE